MKMFLSVIFLCQTFQEREKEQTIATKRFLSCKIKGVGTVKYMQTNKTHVMHFRREVNTKMIIYEAGQERDGYNPR